MGKKWKSIKSLKIVQLFCCQTLLSIRSRTLRSIQRKKKQRRKKEARVFKLFLWDVAFMQNCLTWVPLFQKFKCFFAFPPQNWNFETIFDVGRQKFLSSIEKQQMVYVQPLSWQTINFNRSKTAQTGFEEISKTSINKAPFLLFSHPFVTLRSYRVPMEIFWLQNDINSCSIACRNRDFKWLDLLELIMMTLQVFKEFLTCIEPKFTEIIKPLAPII